MRLVPATPSETEDYAVNLDGVTTLELSIVPEISDGAARASLAQLGCVTAHKRALNSP